MCAFVCLCVGVYVCIRVCGGGGGYGDALPAPVKAVYEQTKL